MGWLKRAGGALIGLGASVATGAVIDPLTGVAVATGLLGGKVAKEKGKAHEARTGRPVHKATAPAAAVATPTVFMALASQFGLDIGPACEAAAQLVDLVCGHPAAAGALAGAAAMLTHQLAGATKAAGRRPQRKEPER